MYDNNENGYYGSAFMPVRYFIQQKLKIWGFKCKICSTIIETKQKILKTDDWAKKIGVK